MAKRHSPPLTREMAATIKWLVTEEGFMQHQAAARFGINQGRVSEVMTGKRFPGIPPAMILS
ncbi:hypothetical protein [Parvibaculum lavamentivorans]|uniref:hypothetical protein n=1 Tax=Parvibaculum lavamentivorans TaxID=256618 RepID=UPI0005A13DD7|nr:hypothetical protein [Parvibaculum lavamentivorans]